MEWTLDSTGAYVEQLTLGGGTVRPDGKCWQLVVQRANRHAYSDAQLHDYAMLRRQAYPWRPPLALSIRARLSPGMRGTAGFGFWNNPLPPLGGLPVLPQAAWFLFTSPPNDLELAEGVPGHGWKAATIDAGRRQALLWAPLAPAVLLACRRAAWRRQIWPRVQRALAVDETLLQVAPDEWHTYQLIWLRDRVIFGVDGHEVLVTIGAPRGPLGLVIWVDNQWARVTPAGSIGWGLLDVDEPQSLEFEDMSIVRP